MSSDDNKTTGHVYDGIEEHDNKLPNWWLGILYGTIIFSYGYWMFFHVTGAGKSEAQAFQEELATRAAAQAAANPPASDDTIIAMLGDQAALAMGAEGFKNTCAACHGAEGQGLIGPNLTDAYWLHGARPTEIEKTIANGVIEKGMPGWEISLGKDRVRAISAYVLSMKGKNVPGKPPQGEKVE